MTQEEKSLLLQDLSTRLPYGVMCSIKGYEEKYWDSNFERYITNSIDKPVKITGVSIGKDCIELDSLGISEVYGYNDFGGLKSYLRPMSSMTEEELDKYEELEWAGDFETLSIPLLDWLNKRMFDYRGLIEKGLALKAPENIYKIYKYDR